MGLNRTRKLLAVMLKWLIIANSLLFNVFECLFSLSDLPGLYSCTAEVLRNVRKICDDSEFRVGVTYAKLFVTSCFVWFV